MSSADEQHTSEVGGLQGVFQNLGTSLGTALVGSVLIASLATSFAGSVASSDLPSAVKSQVTALTQTGVGIVPVSSIPVIADKAGLDASQGTELATIYSGSQVAALRASFLGLILLSIVAMLFSKNLPKEVEIRPRTKRVPRNPRVSKKCSPVQLVTSLSELCDYWSAGGDQSSTVNHRRSQLQQKHAELNRVWRLPRGSVLQPALATSGASS